MKFGRCWNVFVIVWRSFRIEMWLVVELDFEFKFFWFRVWCFNVLIVVLIGNIMVKVIVEFVLKDMKKLYFCYISGCWFCGYRGL